MLAMWSTRPDDSYMQTPDIVHPHVPHVSHGPTPTHRTSHTHIMLFVEMSYSLHMYRTLRVEVQSTRTVTRHHFAADCHNLHECFSIIGRMARATFSLGSRTCSDCCLYTEDPVHSHQADDRNRATGTYLTIILSGEFSKDRSCHPILLRYPSSTPYTRFPPDHSSNLSKKRE